jgi:hypothetical protein
MSASHLKKVVPSRTGKQVCRVLPTSHHPFRGGKVGGTATGRIRMQQI